MRALSLMMSDVEGQAIMQRLASDYDELADRAATRIATCRLILAEVELPPTG
jgi:hypothetical protein